MLDFVTRPLRWVLDSTERDVVETVHETRDIEANMLGAVEARRMPLTRACVPKRHTRSSQQGQHHSSTRR